MTTDNTAFDPDWKGDNDWLLGIAKVRAAQIVRLIDMCLPDLPPGEFLALRHGMDAIRKEAQAIMEDTQP